jgi:hypothetical protein
MRQIEKIEWEKSKLEDEQLSERVKEQKRVERMEAQRSKIAVHAMAR